MKNLTNYFSRRNLLFKSLKEISPKELGSRKKIKIFSGIDLKDNYYVIFVLNGKTKFLKKDADNIIFLLNKLITQEQHNYKKKVLLISNPICLKAKNFLKQNLWRVDNDFM